MAETLALTTPITRTSGTTVDIERITIDRQTQSFIVQWLVKDSSSGVVTAGTAVYSTPAPADHPSQPTGATLLHALNTANLTSNSLIKRILSQLVTDGYIAGTISGTPD